MDLFSHSIRALLGLTALLVMGPWFLSPAGSMPVEGWTTFPLLLALVAFSDLLLQLRSQGVRSALPGLTVLLLCLIGCGWNQQFLVIIGALLALGFTLLGLLSFLLEQIRRGGALVVILFFLAPVVVGTALLTMPRCQSIESSNDLVLSDALFTAISAVTVTGLTVIDVGSQLSIEGQWVLLGLIQLGGLGVISLFAFFTLVLGEGLGIRQGRALREALAGVGISELRNLLAVILISTLLVESIGTLFLIWATDNEGGLFDAIFHAVSAFCNAGFSLHSSSLEGYSSAARMVMALLIIIGGLGFPVLHDLWRKLRSNGSQRFPLQTRLTLLVSLVLLISGGVLLLISGVESDSWFWSVTARTAGFNTSATSALPWASTLVLMVLMSIGASPGSTGGGLKTTTVGVLFLATRSELRGGGQVVAWNRVIPDPVIRTAAVLAVIGMLLWGILLGLLLAVDGSSEKYQFIDYAFEVTSALATVGLSRGVTSTLSETGRSIIEVAMICGRLGPLALVLAMASISSTAPRGDRPPGRVMLG
ncbi:MAG: ATPase [Planctomycetota bacterium]|nr:ATPase [Planctomycetota bacterium]